MKSLNGCWLAPLPSSRGRGRRHSSLDASRAPPSSLIGTHLAQMTLAMKSTHPSLARGDASPQRTGVFTSGQLTSSFGRSPRGAPGITPRTGILPQRLATKFATDGLGKLRLRRRIPAQNLREFSHSQAELSRRSNDLKTGGGATSRRSTSLPSQIPCSPGFYREFDHIRDTYCRLNSNHQQFRATSERKYPPRLSREFFGAHQRFT